MKRMGVFVGIAAVSFPAITFAQSSIEVGERREPVFYSESQFVITLDDTLASEATISQLNVAGVVKNDSEPTTWGNGFWVIEVSDTLSVNEAVTMAGSITNVLCAKPLEVDEFGRPYNVTDMVIVRYANAADTDLESELTGLYGLQFVDQMRTRSDTKVYALGRASCDHTIEISNNINAHPDITWSEPVYAVDFMLEYEPNDSLWPMQWNFKNVAQYYGLPDADIDLDLAWDITFGDSNVIIAVIDDGITWHQDFALAVIDSGYDFVGEHYYAPTGDDDPSPGYYQYHGMACAGLMAGSTDTTGDQQSVIFRLSCGNAGNDRRIGGCLRGAISELDLLFTVSGSIQFVFRVVNDKIRILKKDINVLTLLGHVIYLN